MVQPHRHLGLCHLPLEVAANSGMIVVIAAMTTLVGATSLLPTVRSALEPSMLLPQRHPAAGTRRLLQRHRYRHPCHCRLPQEVAANLGQTAPIAVTTTQDGAISLKQTAKFALEPSMQVPLRRRALVMRQHQSRLLRHHPHRHHRSRQCHRRHLHFL